MPAETSFTHEQAEDVARYVVATALQGNQTNVVRQKP